MTQWKIKDNMCHSKLICLVPLYVPTCSSLLSSVFLRNEFKRPPMSKQEAEVKVECMGGLAGECYKMENYYVCFAVEYD